MFYNAVKQDFFFAPHNKLLIRKTLAVMKASSILYTVYFLHRTQRELHGLSLRPKGTVI